MALKIDNPLLVSKCWPSHKEDYLGDRSNDPPTSSVLWEDLTVASFHMTNLGVDHAMQCSHLDEITSWTAENQRISTFLVHWDEPCYDIMSCLELRKHI